MNPPLPVRLLAVIALAMGCAARPRPTVTPPQAPAASPSAEPDPGPPATQTAPEHLSRDAAEADARRLFELLEGSHPDPYRGMGGKVEFKRRAQALIGALPADGLSTAAFGDRLAEFLAPLGDGHTFVRTTGSRWRDPDPFVPISFEVTRDGLYIAAHDVPALAGKRGWKVEAAAGVALDELASRLAAVLAVENRIGAYAALGNMLRSRKLLGNLVEDPGDAYPLRIVSNRGRHITVEIPLTGSTEAEDAWSQPREAWSTYRRSEEPYESRFFGDVAYLRVGDMMGREAFESMMRFGWGDPRGALTRFHERRGLAMPEDLDEALSNVPSILEVGRALLEEMRARETEVLIVDLRGNTGGVTTTFIVFAQMLHGEAAFGVPFWERFVQVPSPLLLEKYGKTLEAYAKERATDLEAGDYHFGRPPVDAAAARREAVAGWKEAELSYAAPMEALGAGSIYTPPRVVALCDAGTFSAGFHAVYFLDQLGARVVGVPSRQSPNAFMEVTPFVLPASKLTGSISNSAHILLPDDPAARIYPVDDPVDGRILARYGFDREAILRYAIDLLEAG